VTRSVNRALTIFGMRLAPIATDSRSNADRDRYERAGYRERVAAEFAWPATGQLVDLPAAAALPLAWLLSEPA
jgi:hypothetical protein